MRGKEDGIACAVSPREDIPGGVLAGFESERLQPPFEFGGDGIFLAGRRIDGNEFEEGLDDPVAINHAAIVARTPRRDKRSWPLMRGSCMAAKLFL